VLMPACIGWCPSVQVERGPEVISWGLMGPSVLFSSVTRYCYILRLQPSAFAVDPEAQPAPVRVSAGRKARLIVARNKLQKKLTG